MTILFLLNIYKKYKADVNNPRVASKAPQQQLWVKKKLLKFTM